MDWVFSAILLLVLLIVPSALSEKSIRRGIVIIPVPDKPLVDPFSPTSEKTCAKVLRGTGQGR